MSNDKKPPHADNAFFTDGFKPFGDPNDPTIVSHEMPHGLPFVHSGDYRPDNLFWDGDGLRGRIGDDIIDGFLAPVKIFNDERELHSEVYQAEVDAKHVFWCGNHALVAQGQHLAGVWEKKNLEFRLVHENLRIPEPPTYADIRKD